MSNKEVAGMINNNIHQLWWRMLEKKQRKRSLLPRRVMAQLEMEGVSPIVGLYDNKKILTIIDDA